MAAMLGSLLGERVGSNDLPRSVGDDSTMTSASAFESDGLPADDDGPHESFSGFFELHGSSRAWKESVWDQYLTQPAVLLPLSLALATPAVFHWDRRLERHWQGVLGRKQSYSNIGVYTLMGVSAITGALFPGEGRNSWDESWTVAESFLASYLT